MNKFSFPSTGIWIRHFRKDILPFWQKAQRHGGLFHTYLRRDATPVLLDGDIVHEDFAPLCDEVRPRLRRRYTRCLSRLIFLYGVAYHLTGSQKYLSTAQRGMRLLLAAREPDGQFASWVVQGRKGPAPMHRTSQDMAYALVGPAFYYYLTRDPAVEAMLIAAWQSIFAMRKIPSGHLSWVAESWDDYGFPMHATEIQLVAQLDQLNAYLVLLARLLPEYWKAQAIQQVKELARLIHRAYYNPTHNLFWGCLDDPKQMCYGGHHVDFGHTAKSFWMLHLIGSHFDDAELASFAAHNGRRLLDEAFLQRQGTWGMRQGEEPQQYIWWIHCELDQLAATLALEDSSVIRYLNSSYAFWLEHFVDHTHGEVWHTIDTNFSPRYPKVYHWKSGYHTAEHALVGALTDAALSGKKQTLYFATNNDGEYFFPYYFNGKIYSQQRILMHNRFQKISVTFENIGLYAHNS